MPARLTLALTALVLSASFAGCGGVSCRGPYVRSESWGVAELEGPGSARRHGALGALEEPPPPSLSLDEGEVTHAITAQAVRREARAQAAAARPASEGLDVESAAREVSALWGLAQRERAAALIGEHPGLLELEEARAAGELSVACTFVQTSGRGGVLELTLTRARAGEALAVCVPPGTAALPAGPSLADAVLGDVIEPRGRSGGWVEPGDEHRYRHWPSPQDLALLQASVVVLPAGETRARVTFPVACAAFEKRGPAHGQRYRLERFPADSPVDRLLVALCAGELEAGEAELQLAVWLARNDITWEQFKAEGGHWGRLVTFGEGRSVFAEHAAGAARILLDSGVDPRGRAFFGAPGPIGEPAGDDDLPPAAAPQEAPSEPAPVPAPRAADALEG